MRRYEVEASLLIRLWRLAGSLTVLAALATLIGGCGWHGVNAYDTPAHIACANLHDGIQSDSCHTMVWRSGDLESTAIAEQVAQSTQFNSP